MSLKRRLRQFEMRQVVQSELVPEWALREVQSTEMFNVILNKMKTKYCLGGPILLLSPDEVNNKAKKLVDRYGSHENFQAAVYSPENKRVVQEMKAKHGV